MIILNLLSSAGMALIIGVSMAQVGDLSDWKSLGLTGICAGVFFTLYLRQDSQWRDLAKQLGTIIEKNSEVLGRVTESLDRFRR